MSYHAGHQKIEQRIQTIRIYWIAMLLSTAIYYFVTVFVEGSENRIPNRLLSFVLVLVGLVTTLISYPIKKKILNRAIELQRVELVQQGHIYAWALAEVAALLGVLDYFVTGNRYYFVLFLIAVCGQLIHFPKRQHVIDASASEWQAIDAPQSR